MTVDIEIVSFINFTLHYYPNSIFQEEQFYEMCFVNKSLSLSPSSGFLYVQHLISKFLACQHCADGEDETLRSQPTLIKVS